MPETVEDIEAAIEEATTPAFANSFARGEARSMIWRDGVLPETRPRSISYSATTFSPTAIRSWAWGYVSRRRMGRKASPNAPSRAQPQPSNQSSPEDLTRANGASTVSSPQPPTTSAVTPRGHTRCFRQRSIPVKSRLASDPHPHHPQRTRHPGRAHPEPPRRGRGSRRQPG